MGIIDEIVLFYTKFRNRFELLLFIPKRRIKNLWENSKQLLGQI